MFPGMSESSVASHAPVSGKARVGSIDTLRGVAVLGILIVNILAFGLPWGALSDPTVDGATEGINFALFVGMEVFIEGGMRTLFSMLFGAGLLIFMNKPELGESVARSLYLRRIGLLIAFGLFNGLVLLSLSDILFFYGVVGLLLFLFRNLSPRALLAWACGFLLLMTAISSVLHVSFRYLGEAAAKVQALPAEVEPSEEQQASLDAWEAVLEAHGLTESAQAEEIAIRQSGYVDNFIYGAGLSSLNEKERDREAWEARLQTVYLLAGIWDVLAMMLLGMALMRWCVFDASRSLRFYLLLMLFGFGVGLPLNAWETITYVESGYQLHWQSGNRPAYDLGRLLLALGYIGLVMAICRSGLLQRLQEALAAVGRMALTNYLMQSLLGNLVFLGAGLGQFAQWQRQELYLFVLGLWLFQIVSSVYWLRRYRFGPCEWLWRSLTYGRWQPMRLPG